MRSKSPIQVKAMSGRPTSRVGVIVSESFSGSSLCQTCRRGHRIYRVLGKHRRSCLLIKYLSRLSLFHRVMLCTWSLASLIVSSSYAGSLKAALMNPTYGSQLDTLQAVVDSGYPVAILDDGEEENRLIEVSTDPVIKHIYDNRLLVDLMPRPVDVSFYPKVFGDLVTFVRFS